MLFSMAPALHLALALALALALVLAGALAGSPGAPRPPIRATMCGLGKKECKEGIYCRWTKSAAMGGKCVPAANACDAVQGRGQRKKCSAVTSALGGASPLTCRCSRRRGKCGKCVPWG